MFEYWAATHSPGHHESKLGVAELQKAERAFFQDAHNETREVRRELAQILRRQGKYDEAGQIMEQVVEEYKDKEAYAKELEGSNVQTQLDAAKRVLRARHDLAELNVDQGNLEEAFSEFQAILERLPDDDPDWLRCAESQAKAAVHAHREGIASIGLCAHPIPLLRKILILRMKMYGAAHAESLRTMIVLADALLAQGDVSESADLLMQGLTMCEEDKRAYPLKGDLAFKLAELRIAENKVDEATALYQVAFEHQALQYGRNHPSTLAISRDLAAVLEKGNRLAEAEKLYSRAATDLLASRGLRHRDTVLANEKLVDILRAQGKPHKVEAMRLLELPEGNSLLRPEKSYATELAEGKLFLDGNQYETLPIAVEAFTELQVLDLEWNMVTELPETIARLTNLEELWIRGNRITVLPRAINALGKLKVLHCDGNQISSLPDEMQMLTALERLDMYDNQLVEAPWLPALVGLTDLNLGGNRLETLSDGIRALTLLTSLELRQNRLTSLPGGIGELSRLHTLGVTSNLLQSLPATIGQLSSLRKLFVDNNEVILPDEISVLTELTVVNVEDIPQPQSPVVEQWLSNLNLLGRVSDLRFYLMTDVRDNEHLWVLPNLENGRGGEGWIPSFQEMAQCDKRTAAFYIRAAIGRGKGLQGALAFYFGEGGRAPAPSSFEYDALLTTWHVPISMLSVRTYNPIRQIVSSIRKPTSAESRGMELVPLSLGDPTIFKNMPICDTMIRTLHANIDSHDCDGYTHPCGTPSAREAIAKRYALPISPVTKDDVIITSGCSGALNLAISAMIDEGDNVLLPCPGFALYNTIVRSRGGECRGYNLVAERGWECDLEHMESQIDSRTRCILINNPSNPCGSVFSLAHLQDIVTLAERHCLPIIADEIYGGIVFGGEEMHPLAAVSANVPIVTCGGIAKEFLVPGWRLGWIVVHDRNGILADCKAGMQRLATLTLGANTLVQNVLPAILTPGPGSEEALSLAAFHEATSSILQANAEFLCAELADNPCLEVIAPAGGAYPIVGTVCAALHAHLIPPYRERGGAGAHCPFPTLRLCPSFLPSFLPSFPHPQRCTL